jgi:WD40 repeat protein
VINEGSWDIKFSLSHNEDISSVYFSPNRIYLLCIGVRSLIAVWNLGESQSKPLFTFNHSCRISDAKWHPLENVVYLVA